MSNISMLAGALNRTISILLKSIVELLRVLHTGHGLLMCTVLRVLSYAFMATSGSV
jgi:hypothetical protein